MSLKPAPRSSSGQERTAVIVNSARKPLPHDCSSGDLNTDLHRCSCRFQAEQALSWLVLAVWQASA